jgi:predicted transcriptional regulator
MLKMIGTLRSSLAKNAMICLSEMFKVLKGLMDKSLDLIISKIMKKGMEKTNFLLTEV